MLSWPPQSPDLNPIEHLWNEMERRHQDKHPKSKEDLKNVLSEVWENIEEEVCQKLVGSMRKRFQAVIKARGGPTKY